MIAFLDTLTVLSLALFIVVTIRTRWSTKLEMAIALEVVACLTWAICRILSL